MYKTFLTLSFLLSLTSTNVLADEPPANCPKVGASVSTDISLDQIKHYYSKHTDDKRVPAKIADREVELEIWVGESSSIEKIEEIKIRNDRPRQSLTKKNEYYCAYTLKDKAGHEKGGATIYYTK